MDALVPWLPSNAALMWAILVVMVYFTVALWETFAANHTPRPGQGRRWVRSASFYIIGLLVSGLCVPIAATTVVDWADLQRIGLFNQLQLPTALAALLGVVLLDFGAYVTHRAMHAVPVLWRFHGVHHSDLDVDCATDLLHHPIELLIGIALYFAQLLLWGLPYESVLIFALLGIISSPWQHGNLKLPTAIERYVSLVLVTPEMHRIHHSSAAIDGNRNFSAIFKWWDGLLGTYARAPIDGWSALRFGLAERQNAGDVTFFKLLFEPLGVMPRLRFDRRLTRPLRHNTARTIRR
ncbi:MAG: sterol desaturase family protein [Steroidobacteraceae bacterium]